MPESSQKPLLTFAVAGFNQEAFVEEAVKGAFSQTYSPLELILSDDCSQDRTFEIMREMAAVYRGPHRVILNRNPARRSIGGHINRIVELSKGELIITAAGDDISLPERAQVT
jgi:glycosyltransferase involved in cell wall biosynthesis